MGVVTDRLLLMSDEVYRNFCAKLIPNIAGETIIGIKTPELCAFAKQMPQDEAQAFLNELPHKYFEENQLHAFVIAGIKDYDRCLYEVNRFLPYVDNWATCDQLSPKVFAKNTEKLIGEINAWMASDLTYTVRFGIGMLMKYYLGERFTDEYAARVAAIRSDEYYIKMMVAWYFATALAKQSQAVLPYFEVGVLDEWTRRKAIQKANESRRVDDGTKAAVNCLK